MEWKGGAEHGGIRLALEEVGNRREAAVVTIARHHRRNAMDWGAIDAFRSVLTYLSMRCAAEAEMNDEGELRLCSVVVTGEGSAFCSGGDVKALTGGAKSAEDLHLTVEDSRRLVTSMTAALLLLERMPVLTIAAVNGAARGGGCELLLACDLRLVAPAATLSFVQVQQGITTAWGGMHRLRRLVGPGKAAELLLLAPVLDAAAAKEAGLANAVAAEGARAGALAWARRAAAFSLPAVAAMKHGLRAAHSREEAAAFELQALEQLWPSREHAAAVAAFLNKTAPRL